MKLRRTTVIVMLGISFVALSARAQRGPAKRGRNGQTKPPAKPDLSAMEPRVLATVGKIKITEDEVNRALAGHPGLTAEEVIAIRKRLIGQLVELELMDAYLKTAPCPADKLAEAKKKINDRLKQDNMTIKELLEGWDMTEAELETQMRMEVAMQTLREQAVSKEKIDGLVKSAPAYFDGTTLEASHILIMVPLYASQADKAKARKTLADIAKQIADGKITFEDAARKHSACPSSEKGGALGQAFTFDRMDPAFSKAAFALEGDKVSGVVESSSGFHLIKVTKREKGTGKAGNDAKELAGRILMAGLQADIIRKAAIANPVVIKN